MLIDFCRAMLCISAAYAVMRCLCRLSVCLSVCLSRSWIMSKRINIYSHFFHHRVAPPTILFFSIPNRVAIFRRELLTGASNAGRVGKKRDSGRISGFAAYRYTVLSTVRVAKCDKQSRDERLQASSTPRRPSSVVRTRRRRSVCDGVDVICRRRRSNPLGHYPRFLLP